MEQSLQVAPIIQLGQQKAAGEAEASGVLDWGFSERISSENKTDFIMILLNYYFCRLIRTAVINIRSGLLSGRTLSQDFSFCLWYRQNSEKSD